MYVENPNSGLVKAKVIKREIEVNTFLSGISKKSVVLKKMNSSCIICIKKLIPQPGWLVLDCINQVLIMKNY